jgi:hypothetical protein
MNVGMLWFDNDPRTGLGAKIERAAGYYRQKYGRPPDLCLVHPSMLASTPAQTVGPIVVRPNPVILPGHLWIGVEDQT